MGFVELISVSLGHYRKVVFEGDVENRETHKRFSRPE